MTATFQGSTVLVTGGGSGIGFAMASLFLDCGATVIAADIDPTRVPDGAMPFHVDVRDPSSVGRMISATVSRTGRIDVLCSNAGISAPTDIPGVTDREYDEVMAVNARGVFYGMRAVLPQMIQQGTGAIVNTASVAAMIGILDRFSYSASKGAVIAMTRQVAVQYADAGVRCNCVCPGTVETPLMGDLLGSDAARAKGDYSASCWPLGRTSGGRGGGRIPCLTGSILHHWDRPYCGWWLDGDVGGGVVVVVVVRFVE